MLVEVWALELAAHTGKSDQNVINTIVVDFLHGPYRSHEDPMDVVFGSTGVHILPFSVGISVGSAKGMAALSILHAVTSQFHQFDIGEVESVARELFALCTMKATTDPGDCVFSQIKKTIGKKTRVGDRSRPHPIQMELAFMRVLKDLVSKGDKRKGGKLLTAIIKEYNASQPPKSRLNSDEKDGVAMLADQVAEFKDLLRTHWRNYPVKYSAVPVINLALPWLVSLHEPSVKKADNPLHYSIQSPSPQKNLMWLKMVIGKYVHKLAEAASTGKAVNLQGMAGTLRQGNDLDHTFYCVGLYCHFESAFKQRCGVLAVQELEAKFFRGALERELMEKVKAKDPALTIEDFRFVQAAMVYDPNAQIPRAPRTQEAVQDNQSANFKLDLLLLAGEQGLWTDHLRATKAFNADTLNAKVAHMEAGSGQARSKATTQHEAFLTQ